MDPAGRINSSIRGVVAALMTPRDVPRKSGATPSALFDLTAIGCPLIFTIMSPGMTFAVRAESVTTQQSIDVFSPDASMHLICRGTISSPNELSPWKRC